MTIDSLRSPQDFIRVLKQGIRKAVGGIVLVGAPGEPDATRFGLIVSRKVGNAVERNRAKRRLRHTVHELKLPSGMDYVIIASKSVIVVEHDTLRGWLERAITEFANA